MRTLLFLPVVLIFVAMGALYVSYGQTDPCRALATERARRAEAKTGLPIGDVMEQWSRIETSQLSTGQCVGDLFDSWGERLSHYIH